MDTALVISYFVESAPDSLENHQRYAAAMGYRHQFIDAASGPRGAQGQTLRKYEILVDAFSRLPADTLVLVLSEDAAIVDPVPLTELIGQRDHLLIRTSAMDPQVDMHIWRNTPASQQAAYAILLRCRFSDATFEPESRLLAALGSVDWYVTINGIYPLIQSGPNVDPSWSRMRTFAISIDTASHSPDKLGKVLRFRETLVAHINRCRLNGTPLFHLPSPSVDAGGERSTYNPGRRIAFVTLYTPDIASYGQMAEHNFRRYCELHDHTLYVYRAVPREVGLSGTANWLKPWLLHAYLQHHEWVFWLDADVLFSDQGRSLDPLLQGRDQLLARDIGQWSFNSGVMGFRQTAANMAVLRSLMDRIASLQDRSTVYASNGDQYHFIEEFKKAGLLAEHEVVSPMLINTPWFFATPDSFIVHYYGMWTQMRTLMMAQDESARRERIGALSLSLQTLPADVSSA